MRMMFIEDDVLARKNSKYLLGSKKLLIINTKWWKKFYKEKNCKICNKVFYVPTKSSTRGRSSLVRSRNAITCSRVCSRKNYNKNKKDI